ncbi:unnamed protein product, partial [Adineta steineri]
SLDDKTSMKIQIDCEVKNITITLFLDEFNPTVRQTNRNKTFEFLSMRIEMIEIHFQQLSHLSYNIKSQIQNFLLDDLRKTNPSNSETHLFNRNFNVDQNMPMLTMTIDCKPNNETPAINIRQVNAQFESFDLWLSSDCLMLLKNFFTLPQSSPNKSISVHHSSNQVPSNTETRINILIKTSRICWFKQYRINSKCLVFNFSYQIRVNIINEDTHLYSSLKDITIYTSDLADLKDSKIEYQILQPMNVSIGLRMNSMYQKFDVHIGDIIASISPTIIRIIFNMINSINKSQENNSNRTEKINSKSLLNPKPLNDASFWFLKDIDIEQTNEVKTTTETSSHEDDQIKNHRLQQLKFNLKLIEVKFELDSDSITKPVIALCLSDLSIDIKNWSSDMSITSRIQIELAVFNDSILAWQSVIEPIINDRGEIISPWCITCSTIAEEDENECILDRQKPKKCGCLSSHENSLSMTEEESKDITNVLNAKNKIHIRAEHLLSVIFTKTTFDLIQYLFKIFMNTYKYELLIIDKSILSLYNLTGYDILLDDLNGIQVNFGENNKFEMPVKVKHGEIIPMKISNERLTATHLPAIEEQINKRRQEFSVEINKHKRMIDINQTSKQIYELNPSPLINWPIQMLYDSQISNYHHQIILGSIIKIYNRTIAPLIILDTDSIETKKYHKLCRLEVNEEHYLPIQPLYMRSSSRLFISIVENDSLEQINDFISFDWINETTVDRTLKKNNNEEIHLVIYKESIDGYSDNTSESIHTCFHIYIKLAVYLINLLPINIECSIDNDDPIDLKSGELYHATSGNKKSLLIFTIPLHNNKKWISESIDLHVKPHSNPTQHMVQFHEVNSQDTMKMILRIDVYQESYRVMLYSPFWILNYTNFKIEFEIDNEKTLIDIYDSPFFICTKKIDNSIFEKKSSIRLYNVDQEDSISHWSEKFSLYVFESTGMVNCKISHNKIYTICINITTTSSGLSKIIKLLPSMAIINKSSVELEIIETISGIEQNEWQLMKPEQIIPFWPCDMKEGIMNVRYSYSRMIPSSFMMNIKHRTLLRMNDEDYPVLHVQVSITDFFGIHIIFNDYKIGHAPILLINCLKNQEISYNQKDDTQIQILSSQHYVYYTWNNPFKPHKLLVSSNGQNKEIEFHPVCGYIENDIFYAVFHDGPQTVLIITDEKSIIKAVTDLSDEMSSLSESMEQYIEISVREIGLSVINDITHEDLFYITINKSKKIWTETRKSLIKPLSSKLNRQLEKRYKIHMKQRQVKTYHIRKHRLVSFNENHAEIIDKNGHHVQVKRQSLDGLWIGYAWSMKNTFYHIRIHHIQIDNQVQNTMFPVLFYPTISKTDFLDIPGKPFAELSALKTTVAQSKTVHFKYFKITAEECVFCADQGLINSFFSFINSEQKMPVPIVKMNKDFRNLKKSFEQLVESQIEDEPDETKIYFDSIHLSPLKVHVSFSALGSKPNKQLLVESSWTHYFSQLLDMVKMQDVILKLDFYERENDRFTLTKLLLEIVHHYEHQVWKQIYVVVLGFDVLGNPFGVVRGVAQGVKSFFHEPYKGAMEGPSEFIEGVASGTEHLVGAAVGGVANAGSKITNAMSKGLATLTFDEDYKNIRIQRKKSPIQTRSDIIQSGKNVAKDVVHSVEDVVKKPIAGAKEDGTPGFFKGLGKGCIGLVARPTSSVTNHTSRSLDLIKRHATHEIVMHRIRDPYHIGRDNIIRPSTAYRTKGLFIFNRLDIDRYIRSDKYIAHINCYENESGWFFATSKHLMFVIEHVSHRDTFKVEWHFQYKELRGSPIVRFDRNQIEIILKEAKLRRKINKDLEHKKIITYENVGEAQYIVDKIIQTMHTMEV